MKGLEIARGYWEAYGKPMMERDFPALLPYTAVGFCGAGSERYGFDDEVSRDHDFEPGFCLFLPGEDVVGRRDAFLLERAYAKLPAEYAGVRRQPVAPVGGNRNGVIRTADFYNAAVGAADGMLSVEAWLRLPDYTLAEAVNGEVFFDGYGEFSRIREYLRQMPEAVRRKRLAGNLLLMAQTGQYNFERCLRHGEPEAAQLAIYTFVQAVMKAKFLLERQYLPYYKWSFRALRTLPGGEELSSRLAFLLAGENHIPTVAREKSAVLEAICAEMISSLQNVGLTKLRSGDLELHAYAVNESIEDGAIRNLHILYAT